MARNAVRFVRRGRIVERSDFAPTETVLDHLRIRERAHGTKEGCAEGDCGACTVAVGRPDGNGGVTWRPVNSCILLLGMVDGAEIVTVEDLASSNGVLHPVQRAMVDLHASQCGFCTPGFVMSLFTLYHAGLRADRAVVNDWLAGNLCRCTGYRPIADAALACCTGEADDAFAKRAGETAQLLAGLSGDADLSENANLSGESGLSGDADLFVGDDDSFFAAPATEDALATLCARHPDARMHLVGDPDRIKPLLDRQKTLRSRCDVVAAGASVEPGERPSLALRNKTDSSMALAIGAVKDGTADAAVSAGRSSRSWTAAPDRWRSRPAPPCRRRAPPPETP